MKPTFRSLAAALLVLWIGAATCQAIPLSPTRSFDQAAFTDVPDDWSRPYIVSCYEWGLMSGRAPGFFVPEGTVSAAEAITAAVRVHRLPAGAADSLPASQPWYQSGVDYALEAGLLTQEQFTDYAAPITRAQLSVLFARVLPPEEYAILSQVDSLPDVPGDAPYAESALLLYRSGILTGVDDRGSFAPDIPVTRAQLAAILCRLVDPGQRHSFLPSATTSETGPIALFDNTFDGVLSAHDLVLVDFSATWCQPCQALAPTLETLSWNYQSQGVVVATVDVDQNAALAQRYQVAAYPTVLLFQNGAEVWRQEGALELADYAALLDRYLP